MLADKVAKELSKEWGTHISIGRAVLNGLITVRLDSITIEDQSRLPMIQASQIGAKMSLTELLRGKFRIYAANIDSPRLYLYTLQEKNNWQFLLDSLSKGDKDKKSPIDLKIAQLSINDGSVKYRHEQDEPLQLNNLKASLSLKEFSDSTFRMHTRQLSFKTTKGFALQQATFNLNQHNDTLRISNATVELPQTKLNVEGALRGKDFNASIGGHITPSDIAAFIDQAKPFNRKVNFNLQAHGNTSGNLPLNIERLDISEPTGQLSISANGQYASDQWNADIHRVTISGSEMQRLATLLKPSVNIPEEVLRLGTVHATGNLQFMHNTLTANTHIDSDAGIADLTVNNIDRQQIIDINTPNFDIGRIIQNKDFGTIDGQATLTRIHNQKQTAVKAALNNIVFRKYNYRNVQAEGVIDKSFEGVINVNDPNLKAEVLLHPDNINAHIAHADFSKLNLGQSWKPGDYSMDLETNLNSDSHNGYARIANLAAIIDGQEIVQNELRIDLRQDGNLQTTNLTGDFGELAIEGRYDLPNITYTLTNILKASLPTMPGLPETRKTNNNFQLTGTLRDATLINKIFGIPLVIKKPATIHGDISEETHQLRLDLLLPDSYYDNSHYKQGQVTISANDDRINAIINLQQLHNNGKRSYWNINAAAEDNQLNADLTFESDQLKSIKGKLHTESTFILNEQNLPTAHINILPSSVIVEDSLWNVHTAQIVYNKQLASISNFAVSHGNQHICVNGRTAKNSNDSITVDLNDIDVAYILNLLNFHAVEFEGNATGKAYLSHLFDQADASAHLFVSKFKFEQGRMGDLTVDAKLNNEKKQIDLMADIADGPFHLTHVTGFVSPQNNDILLSIDAQQTPTEFLQKLCGSFMGNVDMTTTGHVDIVGPLSDVGILGSLKLNGSFLMKPFGTTYQVKDNLVLFSPYLFTFQNDTISDRKDNITILNGTIQHRNLGHLKFDLNATMDNFEVYNFQDYHKNTFSGSVFTSGTCHITGTEDDMYIDFNATPSKNSIFIYNASSPDAIDETNFITWFDVAAKRDHSDAEATNLQPESNAPTPFSINQNTKDIDISGDLHVNFLINATPETTLRVIMDDAAGDYIDLNGGGILRASYYNNGPFHIYGNYVVDHGIYKLTVQNILKRDFQFLQGGTIAFQGEPYDSPINLQAKYTVNGVSLADLHVGRSFANNNIRVQCLMNITGTPNEPKIDFGLEFPSLGTDAQRMINSLINSQEEMNQQVLYLLAIGRFYSQGSNNADTETASQQSQTSLAMQSILSGTISQQINNILNSVVNNNNWNFGAHISTGDEGWNNAEYEGILSGRMLNNRLLFNGQFGYRDNPNANTSFIGDFDLQYLLFPNGNLAIKVYNQTSDRYFTKNSLNTQGVGLVIKRDFTSLRDLFGLKPKKQQTLPTDSIQPVDSIPTK